MATSYSPENNQAMAKRIAFVGNYLPRQCGIATFTTDLCESIAREFPAVNCLAIPVNDTVDGYEYPNRVRLGMVLARSDHPGFKGLAGRLLASALTPIVEFSSPRAWAFSLLGIDGYLQQFSGDRVAQSSRQLLLEKLVDLYRRVSAPGWQWFEDVVSYSNASLPHALLVTGRALGREDVVEIGLKTLRWLVRIQSAEHGHFVPIGSNGFYRRGSEPARFDQQPIEAAAMVSACLDAFRLTLDGFWQKEARRAFEWFLGRNDLHISLYDPATGGCRDGLHADRVNENQGAESTLAFLTALLDMRLANNILNPFAYGKIYQIQSPPRIISASFN